METKNIICQCFSIGQRNVLFIEILPQEKLHLPGDRHNKEVNYKMSRQKYRIFNEWQPKDVGQGPIETNCI